MSGSNTTRSSCSLRARKLQAEAYISKGWALTEGAPSQALWAEQGAGTTEANRKGTGIIQEQQDTGQERHNMDAKSISRAE